MVLVFFFLRLVYSCLFCVNGYFTCMYVCVSVYSINVVPLEARGGIGSLNRELRMVVAIMWVQGIEPGSSGRATSALNTKSSLQLVFPP